MASIGTFKKSGNELQGEIVTLSLQSRGVRIVPETNRTSDNAPSQRGQLERSGTWRAPCRGRPLPASIAGRAGSRPDHPTAQSRCAPARFAGARAESPWPAERTAIAGGKVNTINQRSGWRATHDSARISILLRPATSIGRTDNAIINNCLDDSRDFVPWRFLDAGR